MVVRLWNPHLRWPIPKRLQDEIVPDKDGPIEVEHFTAIVVEMEIGFKLTHRGILHGLNLDNTL
ncbi:hypothetical protein BV53_01615 [Candidatus Synechococcus spongiarum LMB bulk15N]|uniref:Uncharacterized protein n=1 Tax=Candidatus Synechococcus spongiarum LMB bulk15N TaxID=1943583 RepID=A0A1T1D5Y6_9SYNE|nr:hypothetical protein BV53_01615 [Candidatus Synechococcus spongiarum LMB bulk15N]